MSDSTNNAPHSRGFLLFLLLTAVVCGALVMVIEVLGSRVVGPFFGVSLFVWTSLITVTLVALAAGYGVGGWLADRHDSPAVLYGAILASGVLTLLVPLLKGPILTLSMPLGLRIGAFTSTLLLFGPALFLLGCVSPYLVKIATREMSSLGRTVGGFYALSTFGSVVGTVVTGFFLIAYLGVNKIFWLVGFLLVALGLAYFAIYQRKPWSALALIPVFFIASPQGEKISYRPDGTKVTVIHERETFYGTIKVVDYEYQQNHFRDLVIDGLVQGGIDVNRQQSINRFSYLLEALTTLHYPEGRNALVIGNGAGLIPTWLSKRGIHTDVVDIDPDVFAVAQEYFNEQASGELHVADARYYLSQTDQRYDYMMLDVFNGDLTPSHIMTLQTFELIKQRLTPQGVLGINLIASIGEQSFITASVIKTLSQVFDNIVAYPGFKPQSGQQLGNLEVIAYNGPSRTIDISQIESMEIHPWIRHDFADYLHTPFQFPENSQALVLTDEYSPVEFFDAPLREEVRRTIVANTNWQVLVD